MDLTLAISPLLLATALIAVTTLAAWSYGRTTPPLRGPRRWLLTGLRALSLGLLLLLLAAPVWERLAERDEDPLLAVLVDDSESLTLGTGATSPDSLLLNALDAFPSDPSLRFYTFSGETVRRGPTLPSESLRFDGPRTDVAAALQRVESDFSGRNLRGVILLSDGQVTSGRNPAYLAEHYPVPIFSAVLGEAAISRDVRLLRVAVNEIAYAESPLPLRVGLRATGFEGRSTTVTVSENGRRLDAASATLRSDGAEATVDLSITPRTPGLHQYTVTTAPLDGEATTRNNTQTVAVRVLDTARRILLIAGAPSPDLTALRAELGADSSLSVTVRTQRAPGRFYEGPLPENLTDTDLILLAGYPGPATDPATAQRVAEAVESGTPMAFVMTQQTDLLQLGRSFGNVFPVAPSRIRQGIAETSALPTAAGTSHPILHGLPLDPARLSSLPPLQASLTRWTQQPGGVTLLRQQRNGTALSDPLLVVRQDGDLRSAALLGAGSWRWRTLPEDLADLTPAYGSLVDQIIRWTTARRDRRRVRVRPDRTLFAEQEPVTFTGQVYTESLEPLSDAEVRLSVRGPSGEAQPLLLRPLGTGRYVGSLGAQPAGTYTFTAEAARGEVPIGVDQGTFGVGALALEFREPGADEAAMRQVAERSGGRLVSPDSLGALLNELRASGRLAGRPLAERTETPLIALPLLLLILLGALSTEWVLRKRWGLL